MSRQKFSYILACESFPSSVEGKNIVLDFALRYHMDINYGTYLKIDEETEKKRERDGKDYSTVVHTFSLKHLSWLIHKVPTCKYT